MPNDVLIKLAKSAAVVAGLPPALVCAVIEQESSWNTWAINPEPGYTYLWDFANKKPFRKLTEAERISEKPPADFTAPAHIDRDAEWWCQQMSWGLMQVMGAVARERGYLEPFLTALCAPERGIGIGCQHLKKKLIQASGDVRLALLRWNGGSNLAYPDQVLARLSRYA